MASNCGDSFALNVYQPLRALWPEDAWLAAVCTLAEQRLSTHRHGDLARWRKVLERLPPLSTAVDFSRELPHLGTPAEDPEALREILMGLHPWRKGPLCLGGVTLDTEWRSDWKWQRLAAHLNLQGARVLDIGCGNGYFGLRMLAAGARLVVGIDPSLLFVLQWFACRHFSGDIANFVVPLGIEDLPEIPVAFDTVFSMGVLYHRKDPLHHLKRIKSLLRPGGKMLLETLVLPAGREQEVLQPEGRYARMRNVWAIPGTDRLTDWIAAAGFSDCRLLSLSQTSIAEQRSTDWMRFESLEQALDPDDQEKTLEGHPAPIRAAVLASA